MKEHRFEDWEVTWK